MRCPICDFCEEQELSYLGLSTGYLPDGTRNRIDPKSGLCILCLQYPYDIELETGLDDGEVPLLDKEWDKGDSL